MEYEPNIALGSNRNGAGNGMGNEYVETPEDNPFIHYAILAWHWKRLMIGIVIGCVLLGGVYGLIKEKQYTAKAIYMPPSKSDGGLLSQIAGLNPEIMGFAARFTGVGLPAELFVEALRLSALRGKIVTKHGLIEIYGVETLLRAEERLEKLTSVKYTNGGFLEVEVRDTDPQRAADLANAYGTEINAFLFKLNIGLASQERSFVEQRLESVKAELVAAEEALVRSKRNTRTVDIDTSTKRGVEVYTQLKALELALETQLEVLRSFQTDRAPQVQIVKSEIAAIQRQLTILENGNAQSGDGSRDGPRYATGQMPSMIELPAIALEQLRLLREFTIREKLFEYLTTQLEAARLKEAGSLPVLTVADAARPPQRPSSRGLVGTLFIAGFLGVLLAVAAVVGMERLAEFRRTVRVRIAESEGGSIASYVAGTRDQSQESRKHTRNAEPVDV